jgi:hypothetical protein
MFEDASSFLDSVLETMARKNADYCGSHQATDPLANLRLSEKIGLCDTKTAILSRLLDKVQRLVNLTTGHEPQVAETAEDTLQDLVGYTILLRAALLEESA